ncbi:MAG: RNA polymerase factor sigma-54 [Fimbriimonadales bacterium]
MAPQNGFRQTQRQEVATGLRLDPRLILSSRLLQLGRVDLESAIEEELADNPALDRLFEENEPLTDEAIFKVVAPYELKPGSDDAEFRRSLPNDTEEFRDWMDCAGCTPTLDDHLRAQLVPAVSNELKELAEYLIGSLDDRGYLTMPIEEIALETGRTYEEAEAVLQLLQACEPAGVGAANVVDCLQLQLRDACTLESKLARAILRDHLDDFLHRRTMRLARRFKVMPEVIEAAYDVIVGLDPYPGEQLRSAVTHDLPISVTPDIVYHYSETGWTVEVAGADPTHFTIDRGYLRRLGELKKMVRAPRDERKHISQHISRAKMFIECLEQRKLTLSRIAQSLLQHQAGFIQTGRYEFIASVTRTQLARELGLHESTVSRATSDKFVQIATGEVVSFDVFFKPALRIQKMIEEILATEDPLIPLSDEQIALKLAKRGVFVARRTVNKYRDRTKLLSSRKRRSA